MRNCTALVSEMEFDRLGVFTYSPEEDTPAGSDAGSDRGIRKRRTRQAELMELQQEIAFEAAENMVGKEVLVMIEEKLPMKMYMWEELIKMHRISTD